MARPKGQRGEYIPDHEEQGYVPTVHTASKPKHDDTPDRRIFKLVDQTLLGLWSLHLEDDIYDDEKRQNRRARVIRGANSIWVDEQKGFTDDYIAKNKVSLEFNGGVATVSKFDTAVLDFIDVCNANIDNKTGKQKNICFYEHDPNKVADEQMKKQLRLAEAMKIAFDADVDDIYAHANYLGIAFQDKHGLKLNPTAIKNQYITVAQNRTDEFLDSLNSPQVKISFKVKKAIEQGKIDIGKVQGEIYWTDGGFICKLPSGKAPDAYLTEFVSLPENVKVKDQLFTLVK